MWGTNKLHQSQNFLTSLLLDTHRPGGRGGLLGVLQLEKRRQKLNGEE